MCLLVIIWDLTQTICYFMVYIIMEIKTDRRLAILILNDLMLQIEVGCGAILYVFFFSNHDYCKHKIN